MSSDPQYSETATSQGEYVDVWQRLREHLQQSASLQPGELDQQSLARRLSERAKLLRQRMERPQVQGRRIAFLAFNKQQERYGIPLEDIAAVQALEHFTPVPTTISFIRGVTPWRGAILSLVDLGLLFGRPESGLADLRACVIVETVGRRLAIVAQEVEEIIAVSESELAPVPDLPAEIAPEWIIGVHDQNRLILRISELMNGIAGAVNADS